MPASNSKTKKRTQSKGNINSQGFSSIEILIAVAVIVIVGFLAFYSFRNRNTKLSSPPSPTVNSSVAPTSVIPDAKRYWIMGTSALNEVAGDPSARQALANDTIFVPSKKGEHVAQQATGLHIVPVQNFTSEAQLASAINNKSVSSSVKVLLYDNENWSLTPVNEQADLVSYYKQAAALAHAHGYLLIGTPVSKKDPQADIQIAPYVDVLDIQSQFDQARASDYAGHVLPLAQGARKANANLIILSGLSTNPTAGIPTPQELVNDATAVSNVVQGYWLNIPSPGTACPRCNSPQPQIGIEFLSQLGASS